MTLIFGVPSSRLGLSCRRRKLKSQPTPTHIELGETTKLINNKAYNCQSNDPVCHRMPPYRSSFGPETYSTMSYPWITFTILSWVISANQEIGSKKPAFEGDRPLRQHLSPAEAGLNSFTVLYPGFRSLCSLHPGLNSFACYAGSLTDSSNVIRPSRNRRHALSLHSPSLPVSRLRRQPLHPAQLY